MTYKELVNTIGETVDNHEILKDFGYGAITDIKTVDEGERVNYPYAFLNPTQSTRTGQAITYRFNLIVMDVAQEDPTDGFSNYLKVQSACQQYIDDILANLRFTVANDFDLTLNVNLTPFKERFQDTVAGMTATLEIEIPFALNNCITPYQTLVHTDNAVLGTRDYNSAASGTRFAFDAWQVPEPTKQYKIEIDLDFAINQALTDDAAPYNVPYLSILQDGELPRYIAKFPFSGAAGNIGVAQQINETLEVTLEDPAPDTNELFISFGWTTADAFYPESTVPIQEYTGAITVNSGQLKIYELR